MNSLYLKRAILQKAGSQRQSRNELNGFTLVELMVVVVVVGILSATALPKFLGVKDKAKINTQLGEAAGLAKECAAAILTEGPYPKNYGWSGNMSNTGVQWVGSNCNTGNNPQSAPRSYVEFRTQPTPAAAAGIKCGNSTLTTNRRCRIIVQPTGEIQYAMM